QPESIGNPRQPGELQRRDLFSGQRGGTHLVQVLRGVCEREILPGAEARFHERGWINDAFSREPLGNTAIFRGRPDVTAQIDLVARGIDDRHSSQLTALSYQL